MPGEIFSYHYPLSKRFYGTFKFKMWTKIFVEALPRVKVSLSSSHWGLILIIFSHCTVVYLLRGHPIFTQKVA